MGFKSHGTVFIVIFDDIFIGKFIQIVCTGRANPQIYIAAF